MTWLFSPIARIRHATQKRLIEVTTQSVDYYVLIALSAAMAALGLVMDNTAVIIGAMVIAPLVTPLFTFSLSLLIFQMKDLWHAFVAIFFGTIASLIVATIIGYVINYVMDGGIELTTEILSRAKPDSLYFLVALISGLAGAFSYARPKIMESVIGIAIAAAIIPPISVAGIGLAMRDTFLFEQSMLLYLFNIAGICLGSILMFVFLRFGKDIEETESASK